MGIDERSGTVVSGFRWLDAIVTPLFDALRFVAPIAGVPFAALCFGTGIGGPTLTIISGAFPPRVINAYRGAKFVAGLGWQSLVGRELIVASSGIGYLLVKRQASIMIAIGIVGFAIDALLRMVEQRINARRGR